MLSEDQRAEAYAALHAAISGWANGTISFEDFVRAVRILRETLDKQVGEG
ncbi:hypothetical protein KSX_33060 [Ktedonospora formicarum]|uniref:Uncharacterized protein n=1 Tax=Ktedonospora formicarum TaxID=2778364 RepID=A0A8J3I1T5_9CHLR|nr:hypothetical protein KSX_33060 [Ktedonospora formicarum]